MEKGTADRKSHWEKVYAARSHREVSWFAEHIESSLRLIERTGVGKDAGLIDVGGGASTLVDDLLRSGYRDLTVLDISGTALAIAKDRLKEDAAKVKWIESDILASDFGGRTYALWHDRAVFHFLTEEADRDRYKDKVNAHLDRNGFLVLSVFADDGPEKCSLLDVRRHSEGQIEAFFGKGFRTLHVERAIHTTPAKAGQRFLNMILERVE